MTTMVSACLWLTACAGQSSTPTQTPTAPSPAPPATYALTGSVSDQQTGRAIASALVHVMDGVDANKAAVTDSNGTYALTGLHAGEFNLNVTASGYSVLAQKVAVQADTRLSFALQAARRTISGAVTDATSRGVLPNILIVVSNGASAGQSTRTDAAGNYTLTGISAEITSLQASATSYLTSNWAVPAGGDVRVNIVMTRTSGPAPTPIPVPPPTDPPPPSDGVVITFRTGAGDLTTYTESGFAVSPTAASWFFSGYGVPAPSLQFSTVAGVTIEGEIKMTAGGTRFQFKSVDVYSSTTPIPYVFTGLAGFATVFSVAGRQGNTFGNFATVANGQPNASIDTLLIRLTNAAAVCCGNPMGLDNIVVTR